MGLGLSKCWRIITNHGGRVELEEQPGGGECFLIRLPRRPGSDQPPMVSGAYGQWALTRRSPGGSTQGDNSPPGMACRRGAIS